MPSFLEELLNPTLRGGGGFTGIEGAPMGMLAQQASPPIPPEWQPDLAPKAKGPIEIDYSQGIPMPFRGRSPTGKSGWDDQLRDFQERNPIPPDQLPQMQAQAPIPGMLGGNISAVPPGVGGNPVPPPPEPVQAPALPPPVTVGPPPGTPPVAPAGPAMAAAGDEVGARARSAGMPGPGPGVAMPAMPPEQPKGFLQRFDEGTQRNAPLLLALAAGFAGAPSLGTGMSRAFGNAAPFSEAATRRNEAQQLVNNQANTTARALLAKGADPRDVAAAVRNPELMKALVGRYFAPGKVQTANGRVFREREDGSIELLADYSTDKNPKYEEFSTPKGKVKMLVTPQGLKPVPGFEEPVLDEKDKRRYNVTDITKLQEQGGKLQQVANFSKTFQPEFAGYGISAIGDIANTAGRNLPESVVGEEKAKQAAWWQGYDRYKNVIRNELFGSALTASEKTAFEQADIRPGMTPAQVKQNLEYQRKIIANGIKRAGGALVEQGYDPAATAKAYGVTPDFFSQPIEEFGSGAGGAVTVNGKKIEWKVKVH